MSRRYHDWSAPPPPAGILAGMLARQAEGLAAERRQLATFARSPAWAGLKPRQRRAHRVQFRTATLQLARARAAAAARMGSETGDQANEGTRAAG